MKELKTTDVDWSLEPATGGGVLLTGKWGSLAQGLVFINGGEKSGIFLNREQGIVVERLNVILRQLQHDLCRLGEETP